ncbi:beta-1,3-galactosyltransferase 5-like [Lytechinus variegatus]|uniref:beta-1,3-galactosyltransferase 5-like n=1 Tax=Lytechinus variegatus TaxID=7654 RepID=UPI001BB0EE6B|nr:beta-1,3-galactosyltransferase 5-like [Lytechinus variegatus]XP_041479114.1 beta-1,3-galactosyltransferase 5-like [Lytechinus variegatus]
MSRARTIICLVFLGIFYVIYQVGSPALFSKIVRMEQRILNMSTMSTVARHVQSLSKLHRSKAGHFKNDTNAHEYKYIHNPSYTCYERDGSKMKVHVLFFSPTATYHFKRRQAIRETYGNSSHWESLGEQGTMRTVFLLGSTSNDTLQSYIDYEAIRHGDIVQENFHDSYLNLTLKTTMGLKWVTNFCRHAQYAIKIDDDTMMNQRRFFNKMLTKPPLTNYAAGKTWVGAVVKRDRKNKFYLSKEEYPFPHYPPYLDGPVYILSTDVVQRAFNVALTMPIFKWEDVYLGMCLKEVGVPLRDIKNFRLMQFTGGSMKRRVQEVNSYAFISGLNVTEMIWVWNQGRIGN